MFSAILPRSKKQRKNRDKHSPPESPASFYSASANLPSFKDAPPVPFLPPNGPMSPNLPPRFAWSSSKATTPPLPPQNLVIPGPASINPSSVSGSFSPEIQLELGFTSDSLLEDFTDLFDKRGSGTHGIHVGKTPSIQAPLTRDPAVPTTPTRPIPPVPAAASRSRNDLAPIKIPNPAAGSTSKTLPVLDTETLLPDHTAPPDRANNNTRSSFRAPSPTLPHPPSPSASASSSASTYSFSSAYSYASAPDLDWGLSPGGPYAMTGTGNTSRRRGSTGTVSDKPTLGPGNGRLRPRHSHRLTRQDSATLPVDFVVLASPGGGGRRSRRGSDSRPHSRHASRYSRRRTQQGNSRPGSINTLLGSRPGSVMSSGISMSRPGSIATSMLLTPAEPPMPDGAAEVARANAAELTRQGVMEIARGNGPEGGRQRPHMGQATRQTTANANPEGSQQAGSTYSASRRKKSTKDHSRGGVEKDRNKDGRLYVPSPSSSSQDANSRAAGSPGSPSSYSPKNPQPMSREPGSSMQLTVVSTGHVWSDETQAEGQKESRGRENTWDGYGAVADEYLARMSSGAATEMAATTMRPGERSAPIPIAPSQPPSLQTTTIPDANQGRSPRVPARPLPPSPQLPSALRGMGGSPGSRDLPQPGHDGSPRAGTLSPRASPQPPPRSPARLGGAATPHYTISSPHIPPQQHPPPAYPPPSHPPSRQPPVPPVPHSYTSQSPPLSQSPPHSRSQTTSNGTHPPAEPGYQGRSVNALIKPEAMTRTSSFSPEASSLSLGSNSGSGLWEQESDSATSVPTPNGSTGAILGNVGVRGGSPGGSGKFMHPPRPPYSPLLADARKNKSTGDVSQSSTPSATPSSSESTGSSTLTTVAAGGMARARRVSTMLEGRAATSRPMLPIGPKQLSPPSIDRLVQQRQRSDSEPNRPRSIRAQYASDPNSPGDQREASIPILYHRKAITDSLPETPHDFSPVPSPPHPVPPSQSFSMATSASTPVVVVPGQKMMPKPPMIEPPPSSRRRSRPPLPIGPRKPSMRAVGAHAGAASSPPLPTAPIGATGIPTPSTGSPGTAGTRTNSTKALHTPPSPKFHARPVPWRGLTMDGAKWTLTSSQLQDIVGRAIRQSAEASSIRLLTLDVLDREIPAEISRLEALRDEIKARYRVIVRRRRGLFRSIMLYAEGSDSETRARLTQDLLDVSVTCDQLTEELFQVMDQLQQLSRLKDVHSASALAMALRKLNSSFLKQTTDLAERAKQLLQLEAERDEAWAMAERVEQDLIDLQAKMMVMENGLSTPNSLVPSNRSSRVSAARKTSVRASKASLRISRGAHSSHSSMSSQRLSIFGHAPPVPPIPSIPPYPPNLSVNTDLPSASGASLHSFSMSSAYFHSPTPESRALAEAQDELYDMLGISPAELRRTRSGRSQRPLSEVLSSGSLPASPFPMPAGGGPVVAGSNGAGGSGTGSGQSDPSVLQLGSRRRNASFSGQPRPADSMYVDILADI